MLRRYVSIWFPHLAADWRVRRQPGLCNVPFVLALPEHGRMVVMAVSKAAHEKGISKGMVVADCRALFPALQVFDAVIGQETAVLTALAEWCIRFTPIAAVDPPDGLILDVSGCPHLWGGEGPYLNELASRLQQFGYHIRVGMADTIGASWAVSRYGDTAIVEHGAQAEALLSLPPAALRIEGATVERLLKLGLITIGRFISMPRRALRRRFGEALLLRIDQATGHAFEALIPVRPIEPYQERLPCLEPIRTATGIEIALKQVLEMHCERLTREGKGLRKGVFRCYRIDGNVQVIDIGTSRASRNVAHLFKLFELKIPTIEPDLGIELFVLEASVVEDISVEQEMLWSTASGKSDTAIAELLDTIAGRVGTGAIHRYLPAEHYWPEWSYKEAGALEEQPQTAWRTDLPRPLHLLPIPERIEVSVQLPDYPPMLFIHNGELHTIAKADGPERIEQEWWLQQGLQRDYYCVEDTNGCRYWLFRTGHYADGEPKWFLHGFFP